MNNNNGNNYKISNSKSGRKADKETLTGDQISTDNDFDNVFKSMKRNNTNLFIPVINDIFGRNYRMDEKITLLPSEGDLTNIAGAEADINSRTSDFLLRIQDELYLLECQSYNDGSMAIRIAEYAFISAKQNAVWENGRVILEMPNYCVIYVKNNGNTPRYTSITYQFPNGKLVNYDAKNVMIGDYTKEEILQKRLYPYIPYYILRYEKEIKSDKVSNEFLEFIEAELEFLSEGLHEAMKNNDLDVFDYNNIKAFTNTIIGHFTSGDKKERLVNIMGGRIITTEADLILQKGIEQGIEQGFEQGIKLGKIKQFIETSKDFGADEDYIMNGLVTKFDLSLDEAKEQLQSI